MARLHIIIAPDPRLKARAELVEKVDAEVLALMDDMAEAMYAANGIGLAAPQVGVLRRVIVVDVSRTEEDAQLLRMANPEIIWASEEEELREEGCLSLPEQYADVLRPTQVKVRYLDHQNEVRELEADDILSVCVQHEMDHLEGTLFVDHISMIRRKMILKKLQKSQKAVGVAT